MPTYISKGIAIQKDPETFLIMDQQMNILAWLQTKDEVIEYIAEAKNKLYASTVKGYIKFTGSETP